MIVLDDGSLARRDYVAEHGRFRDCAGNWPLCSDAAGVHPERIEEAIKVDRKLGVEAEYRVDGRVVFRDREHRKKFCRAHKMRDRDGGYGDY